MCEVFDGDFGGGFPLSFVFCWLGFWSSVSFFVVVVWMEPWILAVKTIVGTIDHPC